MRNKQGGPGGGTRRLHHLWGRNRIDACGKGVIFARYGTRRYRANVVVANDNTAPVAAAA